MNLIFLLPLLTLMFLTAAFYYFITRDTDQYREAIEKRLKDIARDRGGVSRRELKLLKEELLSDIPVLHRVLLRFEVFTRLQNILRQAEVDIVVNRFLLISLIIGLLLGSLVLLISGSIFATAVVTLGGMSAPLLWVLNKRRLRFKKFLEQLPDALELMVRSLQAGHSFSSALQMVASEMPDPIAKEFGKAYEEQNLGLHLKIALENMLERVPIMDLKMCVTAVLIQREVGGNLSEVLRNISHTIRERFRIQGDIRVRSAQARLSGYVVSCLPFILFFWISLVNPNYMKPMYEHPWGYFILGAGITMQFIGWLIIRKIVSIEV
jgi:tight adherence protein B